MACGGFTTTLLYAVIAAVLGMFQFGYNTSVTNAPKTFIESFIKEQYDVSESTAETLFTVAVSIFAIGGALGCPLGGWLSERYGRKGAIIINSAIGILGGALMGFSRLARSYEMLAIGRFVVGINCGFATTVSPTYVSEISPVTLRGAFGTVNQLAVTIGIVIGQVLGIDALLGKDNTWGWLLGIAMLAPFIQLLLMPACPESPRYLLISKRDEEFARIALRKLRADENIEYEITEIHTEESLQRSEDFFSLWSLLKTPSLRSPLFIGIVMHLSQQFGGINAVFYYSTEIFVKAGLSQEAARVANIGVGCVMVVMTFVTVPLMDRAGRRTLHLTGLAGMFVFSILMTVALFTSEGNYTMSIFAVIFTLGFTAFFALGPGSIPWMLMSELFTQGPRSTAVGVGTAINWISNFIIGLTFLSIATALGNYTFLPFSVLLLVFFSFLYFKLPETKNRPIEEIVALFKKN